MKKDKSYVVITRCEFYNLGWSNVDVRFLRDSLDAAQFLPEIGQTPHRGTQ